MTLLPFFLFGCSVAVGRSGVVCSGVVCGDVAVGGGE